VHQPEQGLVCLAVDGKSARGGRRPDGRPVHLVAAVDHNTGVVRGQVAVDAKSNEITAFVPLLDHLELTGVVITADAMHTQDTHAAYLHRRGAHYVLTVKGNRPTLRRELASLPWKDVNVAFTCTNTGHGRVETRTIKVVRPPRRLSFPHARQAICVRRWRRARGAKIQTETVYALTDLDFDQVTPAQHAEIIRGHWPSRTGSTTCATSPSTKTGPRPALGRPRRSWPPSGTSQSACTASPEPPGSPRPPARSCADPNASCTSSRNDRVKKPMSKARRSRQDQERNRPGPHPPGTTHTQRHQRTPT